MAIAYSICTPLVEERWSSSGVELVKGRVLRDGGKVGGSRSRFMKIKIVLSQNHGSWQIEHLFLILK